MTRDQRPETNARGFTLMEILLAFLILGIVVTTILASFNAVFSSTDSLKNSARYFDMAKNCLSRMALDLEAFAGLDHGRGPDLLVAPEERGDRDLERARERPQRRQRRRGDAVFDLGQHARGQTGRLGQIDHGHLQLLAEVADLAADRHLEQVVGRARMGILVRDVGFAAGSRHGAD